MGAMYRLKAYFGMVPAEEMDEYAEETVGDRFGDPRHWDDRYGYEGSSRYGARSHHDGRAGRGYDDRHDERSYDRDYAEPTYDDRHGDRHGDRRRTLEPASVGAALTTSASVGSGGVAGGRGDDWTTRSALATDRPTGHTVGTLRGGGAAPAVRGALAMDAEPVTAEPVRALSSVPEQRERVTTSHGGSAPRITTLQPRSYNEARTIGERYRDGIPVIMNLTELDDAAAKRLVDFAAGLAFALRGSIDKVTSRVFLLTPADVEVSADDARRIAGGVLRRD